MPEQPRELREYLEEAEAVATEWYSREGLEETHDRNLEALATLMGLSWVIGGERPFEVVREESRIYLAAAFQMGRKSVWSEKS
jgi:hypothetical protein